MSENRLSDRSDVRRVTAGRAVTRCLGALGIVPPLLKRWSVGWCVLMSVATVVAWCAGKPGRQKVILQRRGAQVSVGVEGTAVGPTVIVAIDQHDHRPLVHDPWAAWILPRPWRMPVALRRFPVLRQAMSAATDKSVPGGWASLLGPQSLHRRSRCSRRRSLLWHPCVPGDRTGRVADLGGVHPLAERLRRRGGNVRRRSGLSEFRS